ncbi:MAG: recombinase family protein [Candidatus Scatosoma sp.]
MEVEKIRAVLYARYSSDKQQESSIAVQLAECRKFCKENHITVVREYKDEARTGTDGNREEFQQMLEDACLGEFDLVIVHRWDRFARNVELALSAQKQLEKLGVKVISTLENFDDTPEGDFFKLMSLGMAALYSKRLSREAFNGQIENAQKGKAHGGVALYGYEVVQKKYRIVPTEAEAIRKMFQMVADGYSYKETVDSLNAQGYRRRDGRLLSYSITDTLRNRQYVGEYVFNQYKRSPEARKWRRQKKTESEIVRIQGGMPAIVDEETFERVQKLMDKRKQRKGCKRKRGKYLLSGLIVCGVCGYSVAGNKNIVRGKAFFSYMCGNKSHPKEKKSISVTFLDKYIVNLFTNAFLLMRNAESVIGLMRQILAVRHDEKVRRLKELKKECEEKRLLLVGLEEIEQKNKGKALATLIAENRKEEQRALDELTGKITELQTEWTVTPRINKEKLRKKTNEYKAILDSYDFYCKQEILQTLVEEIKLGADTVETTINLHKLADIELPLTCTVSESLKNVRYVYTLRGLDFTFDRLNIKAQGG